MTTQAEAAAAMRKELKLAFPQCSFRIRSKGYSGGDSVHIYWTDGPTTKEVEVIVKKYQYGHFDGMIDCYEYSNKRADIPQTKYVFTQRMISRESEEKIVKRLSRYGVIQDQGFDREKYYPELQAYGSTLINREASDLSL